MIVEKIGLPATLEQLAEESAELAQAALKYARKLRGENPTPKTLEECNEALIEEYTDVCVCAQALNLSMDMFLAMRKRERWIMRIEENEKKKS